MVPAWIWRLSEADRTGKMYGMRCVRVWAVTVIVFLSIFASGQTAKAPVKPGKIYIGSFGAGEDAEQLKLALGYELGRVGFKTVDFMSQADSWISGLIVTRVEEGKQTKRVTVFLKDRKGNTIWNQDIGATASGTRQTEDAIRQRAQDIARELKKDSAPPRAPQKTFK